MLCSCCQHFALSWAASAGADCCGQLAPSTVAEHQASAAAEPWMCHAAAAAAAAQAAARVLEAAAAQLGDGLPGVWAACGGLTSAAAALLRCASDRAARGAALGPPSLLSLRVQLADFLPVCQRLPALQNVVQADALCTLSAIEEANTRVEELLSEESRERHSVSGGAGQCRGGRGRQAGRACDREDACARAGRRLRGAAAKNVGRTRRRMSCRIPSKYGPLLT